MLWRPLSMRPIFRSVSKRTFSWVKPRSRRIDFNRSTTCSTKMSLRRCRFIIQRSGFLHSNVTTHLSFRSEITSLPSALGGFFPKTGSLHLSGKEPFPKDSNPHKNRKTNEKRGSKKTYFTQWNILGSALKRDSADESRPERQKKRHFSPEGLQIHFFCLPLHHDKRKPGAGKSSGRIGRQVKAARFGKDSRSKPEKLKRQKKKISDCRRMVP